MPQFTDVIKGKPATITVGYSSRTLFPLVISLEIQIT